MKKFLSTLLALSLVLSLCAVPTFAADDADTGSGTVRDTDFFTPQHHTDLNYDEIKYEYIDPQPVLDEIDALMKLAQDEANLDAFTTRFLAVKDTMYKMYAMYEILDNKTYHDAKDDWAVEELAKVDEDTSVVGDAFNCLVRDVLKLDNAVSGWFRSKLTEEDVEDYLEYEDMTDEELELSKRDTALEAAYRVAKIDLDSNTTKIDGKEYNADDLYQAYYVDHTIDLDSYLKGNHEVYGDLADIYLEMIDVRNQIAKLNGYDNYAEYAYAETYDRDYTLEDIEAFRGAVKQYLAPKLMNHLSYLPAVDVDALPLDNDAYEGFGAFKTLAPYFGQLSDELLESMQYLVDHKAYDIEPAPNKTGTGFSRIINYYDMPFYFINNNSYSSYGFLTTTIHEMGHNNNTYWSAHDWTDTSSNIDTAEVHSQALELLMTRFYPELFGEQAGAVAQNTAFDILYSVVQGCIHDELQCYAYTTPNVTAVMLNQKYRQIAEAYGLVSSSDPRPEMYGWYGIPHTFTSPMYYISYATSAAGAFAFWEEAQDDYFPAVDRYLRFTALPGTVDFQDCFRTVGMESPLSPSYIQKLAKTAHDKLMYLYPYTDVYTDYWYAEPIYVMDYYGIIDGLTDDTFAPDRVATRAQTLTALARISDEREDADAPYTLEEGVAWAVESGISDGSYVNGALTREQLATLLYRLAEAWELDLTAEGDLSAFSDADMVSDWAETALIWAIDNGLISGMGDGILNPQGYATRAQLATVLLRLMMM